MRRKKKNWIKLDNAAKIFPPSTNKSDTKVFRFSCELFEDIKKELLENALEQTIKVFPGYKVVLKPGLFWYYLEDTEIKPVIHEEDQPVCPPIYNKNEQRLLFDVSYYKKRINFEVYHALADGTGALHFLRELVCRYIALSHKDVFGDSFPDSGYDASPSEKMADSFEKYYTPQKIRRGKNPVAYKIKGTRLPENRLKVVGGILKTDQALTLAKKNGATLTAFLAATLLCTIAETTTLRERKNPVALSVPVNLRNYFPSESSRNFFGVFYLSHKFDKGETDFKDVLESVKKQMKEKLAPEKVSETMSNLIALEKNAFIRIVPLVLKDFFMGLGYRISDSAATAAFSNIGKIDVPEIYRNYIRLFDVMSSTNKMQACLCSYENNLVISFTDGFVSADIQKNFFRKLSSEGLDIEITSTPNMKGDTL